MSDLPLDTVSRHRGPRLFQDFRWNDENIAYLKKAWLAGDTAAQIGIEIECSRNGVIGKLNRLGLQNQHRDVAKAAERKVNGGGVILAIKAKRRANGRLTKAPVVVAPVAAEPATAIASEHKTLFELTPTSCRYPMWPDTERSGLYCGDPSADMDAGRPYCAEHKRLTSAGYSRGHGADR